MSSIKKSTGIRQLFIDFLLLSQISKETEGISGYELHKIINSRVKIEAESPLIDSYKLSQSRVYRILEDYKTSNYVLVKENVIVNKRLQNLFVISDTGKNKLEQLTQIIRGLFPDHQSTELTVNKLVSGEFSPLDLIINEFSEENLLPQLKALRDYLLIEIDRINKKISFLEKQ